MSCEVGPGSLATIRMPSICGRAAVSAALAGASAIVCFEHVARGFQDDRHSLVDGLIERRAGSSLMAATAERLGQGCRIEPAVTCADTDLGARAVLAEEDNQRA